MENETDRTCSTNGRVQKCMQNFNLKTLSKETTGRCRHKWGDNMRLDLWEIGWIDGAQDRDH
jgi:hypothetical protein